MVQLRIHFTNGKQMKMDVPDLTMAHTIRRSFNPALIADWSTARITIY